MKKLAGILCLSALATGAFAQGLVQFFPTASTLSSVNQNGTPVATSGAAGSYYYALLTAPAGATTGFTFTGTYATNLSVAGYFGSPSARIVNGWAAGATNSFEVAIWSANLGATWNSGWLQANNTPAAKGAAVWGGVPGFFGLSSIATAASGGAGTPATPALALFGGASGIQSGFTAQSVAPVPEPSSLALAGLGAAALLIFRRRK